MSSRVTRVTMSPHRGLEDADNKQWFEIGALGNPEALQNTFELVWGLTGGLRGPSTQGCGPSWFGPAWYSTAGAQGVPPGIPSEAEVECVSSLGPPLEPGRLYLTMQGRNFLRNPTFRRDANTQPQLGRTASRSVYQSTAWVTTTALGDGIAWEAPPAGMRPYGSAATADPPPPLPYPGTVPRLSAAQHAQHLLGFFGNGSGGFGIWGNAVRGRDEHQPGCLATPNDWCEVVQVVDLGWELQRRGLTAAQAAHLLDAELSLRLSVYVGSRTSSRERWDCVGQYSVGLLLDEGNGNANGYGYSTAHDGQRSVHSQSPLWGFADECIPSMQSFLMRPTRHHYFADCVTCTSDCWRRFEYELPRCPRGVRRAVVILRGRRAPNSLIVSPLPRHCGSKFASAELLFA
ncbi:hypothetical protein VOLCADRAFT_88367 [Volvox carteri f. nagariensis]|uniref:Uncharacterized protein n=1 Tax=Volvox carteri f. nagariensis TaxID=3068 RepID=D8TN64_VOLCA|nr:uncharacterized protein VOLCADRAFT_88367 [Volvox carteri f. nagariensis]EFJ50935.1 hypothetical protein VOLCADRAFT_88367 [Volvox carteri f. nagariensis]|eukprot:XP_002947947.1 hypothetical protein VOLCADRAFT_88367 [Volvox carteri f. nagariensis]